MPQENDGTIGGIDFQNDIRKKVFWFTRAKLKTGRWPFNSGYMVEDLTRVIPADFYGGSFESAKLSTRANFQETFNNPSLLSALDARTISSEEREAYALISHGYNSNALLGKIRNAEIKQAVYRTKLYSKSASLDTPFMDAWARISNDEPNISIPQFINVLRAERNLKRPENFDANTRPARIDSSLGYGVPVLENNSPLRSFTNDFDNNDELFNTVMDRISNKIGIELVGRENIEVGKIDIKPKRFFGALDTIKSRLSPYKNGINPTGWPKRFRLEYSNQGTTNTEKLYGVIKCLSGLQIEQLSNIAESVILANPSATNLPSSEAFNADRGRLSSAAACLVASDVCLMIGLPIEQAKMMSETFKLEAQQNLELVSASGKQNKNFMAVVADMYAVGINNFAYDLNPSLEEYADNRGISMESVASKMDGSPSLQGLIYANNVITDPALQFEPDMNSEEIAKALDRVFERGRVFNISLSSEPYGPENRPDLRDTSSEPSVEDTGSKTGAVMPPVDEGFDDDTLGDKIGETMDEVAEEQQEEETPTPEVTPNPMPSLDEIENETPTRAIYDGKIITPETRLRANAETDANRVVTQLEQQTEPAEQPQAVDPMYDPETYREKMQGIFDRMKRVQYNNHPVNRPDLRPETTGKEAEKSADVNAIFAHFINQRKVISDQVRPKEQAGDSAEQTKSKDGQDVANTNINININNNQTFINNNQTYITIINYITKVGVHDYNQAQGETQLTKGQTQSKSQNSRPADLVLV